MDEDSTPRRALEIATAILLGLVSVATALGAYQASEWSRQSGAYAAIGGQLRDETFATSIESRVASFDDNQRVSEALQIEVMILQGATNVEELRAEQVPILAGGSPGLTEEWDAWVASDHDPESFPMSSARFQADQLAPTYGSNRASVVAYALADEVGARSLQIAVASAIFALALLLLGVSGANRSFRIAFGLALGGAGAFVVGLVVSVLAGIG